MGKYSVRINDIYDLHSYEEESPRVVTVGIPRSLGYFDFDDLWSDFFHILGADVLHSPPTNRAILDAGIKLATNGTCLPVKAFYGHVITLLTGSIRPDYLFVPRLVSIERCEFTCPKFIGLPDMIRNFLKDHASSQVRILAPTIDVRKGKLALYSSLWKLGLRLGDPFRAVQAYRQIIRRWRTNLRKAPGEFNEKVHKKIAIGLIGHSYLLEDQFLSMGLVQKLAGLGVEVVCGYKLPHPLIEEKAKLWPKRMFWRSGKIALGSAGAFLSGLPYPVDGVIYAASFGCGTDSITGELVERAMRRANIPTLLVNLDEHTGEAGILTRLEAFVDLIRWRSTRSEVYFPAHGQLVYSNSGSIARIGT